MYYPKQNFTRLQEKLKYDNGILWATWKQRWYSFRETQMWIRPYDKSILSTEKVIDNRGKHLKQKVHRMNRKGQSTTKCTRNFKCSSGTKRISCEMLWV